jgi:hypothetical protein
MTLAPRNGKIRQRRFLAILLLLAIPPVLVSGAISCSKKKSDKDLIQELIDSSRKAAEEKRPGGVTVHLTEDFRDNHGNDKQTVKAVLIREMMNNNNLSAYITTTDISVNGNEATALVKVIVTGSAGLIPDHMDHIRIDLKLRRETDGWMIYSADWKPASEQQ